LWEWEFDDLVEPTPKSFVGVGSDWYIIDKFAGWGFIAVYNDRAI
jgi:hypothetical protein